MANARTNSRNVINLQPVLNENLNGHFVADLSARSTEFVFGVGITRLMTGQKTIQFPKSNYSNNRKDNRIFDNFD